MSRLLIDPGRAVEGRHGAGGFLVGEINLRAAAAQATTVAGDGLTFAGGFTGDGPATAATAVELEILPLREVHSPGCSADPPRRLAEGRSVAIRRPRGAAMRRLLAALPALLGAAALAGADARAGSPADLRLEFVEGARTDVPPSANAAYTSLIDGGPLHVATRVNGAEFHIQGRISSAPGGLAKEPRPVLKVENGVFYWQITGELSATFMDEFGMHYAVGPIDATGANHRREAFGPGAHPRAGLSGAFFALLVPLKGFNGCLIQMQAPADGGLSWPAAPLLWTVIDPMVLLSRGYPIFTLGGGGTVHQGKLADGTSAIDTNPESGTGIFWAQPPAAFPAELVPYFRPALVDASGAESAVPEPFVVPFVIPGFGPATLDYGDPDFFFNVFINNFSLIWYPEMFADSVIFAKNLLGALSPAWRPRWTCWVGWSASSANAALSRIASFVSGEAHAVRTLSSQADHQYLRPRLT